VPLSKAWSESDVERLKAMVASGASALRTSIALKRSLAMTKRKASELGFPFRTDAELRNERRRIFEDAASSSR
jgi:GcrA cell cycle regulator